MSRFGVGGQQRGVEGERSGGGAGVPAESKRFSSNRSMRCYNALRWALAAARDVC